MEPDKLRKRAFLTSGAELVSAQAPLRGLGVRLSLQRH
jgi:hypothetical protein